MQFQAPAERCMYEHSAIGLMWVRTEVAVRVSTAHGVGASASIPIHKTSI